MSPHQETHFEAAICLHFAANSGRYAERDATLFDRVTRQVEARGAVAEGA